MNLSMTALGGLHSLICLYAMWIGGMVLWARKGGSVHRQRGRKYAIALTLANVSAFGLYSTRGFGIFHWMAVATLLSLAIAVAAAYWKRPSGIWLRVHLTAIIFSYYMLWGGAVNEAFLRVTMLNSLPSFAISGVHTILMLTALMMMAYFFGKTSRNPAILPPNNNLVSE